MRSRALRAQRGAARASAGLIPARGLSPSLYSDLTENDLPDVGPGTQPEIPMPAEGARGCRARGGGASPRPRWCA